VRELQWEETRWRQAAGREWKPHFFGKGGGASRTRDVCRSPLPAAIENRIGC